MTLQSVKQKYRSYMQQHPKVDRTKEVALNVALTTGRIGCYLTGAFLVIGALGAVITSCEKANRRAVLRPDDRKATLIEKKDNVLFLDTDGNTDTAEVMVRTQSCPVTVEAVRRAKIGEVRKVSEWKGSLVDENCWESHFEWINIKTKEREGL